MGVLRIHLAGDWGPAEVGTSWAASTLEIPALAQDRIDRAWTRAGATPGINLFDGPMCRMESWRVDTAGMIHLAMSHTTYKVFFGTNLSHPELADQFGARTMANPVGVSPALETADGFLLLGRRNASVAYYPQRLHPFAGCVEPDDAGKTGAAPDLFAAVRRELAEELSLTPEQVPLVRLTGIVEDQALRQAEVIFRARCTLTRAELESQLDAGEHRACWAVAAAPEKVTEALREPLLTPVAAGALLLWGRVEFGIPWYEANAPAVVRPPSAI